MPSQMLGVRLTEREEEEIKKLVEAGLYISASEFIRDSVRKNLAAFKAVEIRDVPRSVAKKEVLNYLKGRKEAYASDISGDLGLDLELAFSILKELKDKDIVE